MVGRCLVKFILCGTQIIREIVVIRLTLVNKLADVTTE